MIKTSGELACIVGGTLYGDPEVEISDVSSAESAGPAHVTFARGEYAQHIEELEAGVILVDKRPEQCTKNLIVVEDCRSAFGKLIEIFSKPSVFIPGIHPTAQIDETAQVGNDVCIMAYAVIGKDTTIGDGTVIYPHTYIGEKVIIGSHCEIHPGVTVYDNSRIGDRVTLRAQAVIGGQGFGFSTDEMGRHTHIRQLGNVILEDDVEVGAGTMVDNGSMNSTIVHRGTKIDNLVHIGHNVEIGEDCFIIAQVGIAGSTKIGNHCVLAGQSGVTGHITITDGVTLGGKTGVLGNIDTSGTYVGFPARPHGDWRRMEVVLGHLPEIVKKVKRLEKLLAEKE